MTRLRVVHVGVGLWGQTWAEHIARAPGYRLVGVADAGAEARAWAEQALAVPSFRDLARALAAVDPDVVVLASPPSTHRPLAELSLAAGCHVVVEKPLALTVPDAAAIADAAASAGRIAMVRRTTASGASRARSMISSPHARSGACSESGSRAAETCATRGSPDATGAGRCRTRTSSTWRSTTSTWCG